MGCGSSSLKDTDNPNRVPTKVDSFAGNGKGAAEEARGDGLTKEESKPSVPLNSADEPLTEAVPEQLERVEAEDPEVDETRATSGLAAETTGDSSNKANAPEMVDRRGGSEGTEEDVPRGSPASQATTSGGGRDSEEPRGGSVQQNGRSQEATGASSPSSESLSFRPSSEALSFPSPPATLSFASPPSVLSSNKPRPGRPHSGAMVSLDENDLPTASSSPPPSRPPVELREFTWRELVKATDGFSNEKIVSEGGRQAANIVFRGKLSSGKLVSVCKLSKREWLDEEHFVAEAKAVAQLRRLSGVISLQGYCTENGARMLVADFMPTLARYLFHYEVDPMPWAERIRIAISILRTLQLACSQNFLFYHDVNVYTVLYDKNSEPKLSCFGLLKCQAAILNFPSANRPSSSPPPPDAKGRPAVTPASLVYSFGLLLQALLAGRTLTASKFLELVREEATVREVVDSTFQQDTAEYNRARALIPAVVSCLAEKPDERPSMEQLLATLRGIQGGKGQETQTGARLSDGFSRSPDWTGSEAPVLSRLGVAARDCDLLSLHNHLVEEPRDYTPPAEPSFESWNPDLQEKVRARKLGDRAFKAMEWEEAIKKYKLYRELDYVKMPIMFARRCLCYLQTQSYELALRDAMTAHFEDATWPEALYLQAAALRLIGEEDDADAVLSEATKCEEEKLIELQSRSRNASPSSSMNGDYYRRRSREGE